jgi:hypothetical protein
MRKLGRLNNLRGDEGEEVPRVHRVSGFEPCCRVFGPRKSRLSWVATGFGPTREEVPLRLNSLLLSGTLCKFLRFPQRGPESPRGFNPFRADEPSPLYCNVTSLPPFALLSVVAATLEPWLGNP